MFLFDSQFWHYYMLYKCIFQKKLFFSNFECHANKEKEFKIIERKKQTLGIIFSHQMTDIEYVL